MSPTTAPSQRRPVAFARSVALAALLAVSVCSVSQDKQSARTDDTNPDENDIKQIFSMYAKAADEADPNVASHVWCDSSEDSLINPIGRWHGVEQIMGFYRHEMGDTYSARNLRISDISVRVYTNAAWAEFNWDFAAKLRKDGSPVSFHGMETQIYRKTHNGWCLVHVHYSALPAEEKPTGTK
jgi:ketosteroid isomerase-like protein